MAEELRKASFSEMGVSGGAWDGGRPYERDFLPKLRGTQGIRKYREMKENDPIVGAILSAMDMMLRDVDWRIEAANDTPQGLADKEFLHGVLFEDMSSTFDEFTTECISFLPYGFSFFEVVYKRRVGPNQTSGARRSIYSDNRIGIRKLSQRPQWSLERWEIASDGQVAAFVQSTPMSGQVRIPIERGLLFRTQPDNQNPSGMSILRNAYTSYQYASHITNIEAIAIERELNGVPVGRIPAEYLSPNATASQQAVASKLKQILRDVKFNEQGYVLLPSDTYVDESGKITDIKLMDFELITSKGTRAIDTGAAIVRHQQDMARTVLADFVLLGQNDRGSFALSQSKTDLFLRALEGHVQTIASTINRHLVPKLWRLNGLNVETMPKLVAGQVAPVDLKELAFFLRNISGAGIDLGTDPDLVKRLRELANLPAAVVKAESK